MGKPLMGEGGEMIKNLFTRLSVNPTPVQGLVPPRFRAAVTQPSRNLPSSFHAVTCPLEPTPPMQDLLHQCQALWAHHGLLQTLGLMAKRQLPGGSQRREISTLTQIH